MESEPKRKGDGAIELLVVSIMAVALAYPGLMWLKHKIEAKVAADVSVAQSLKRIADRITPEGQWQMIQKSRR